MTVLRGDYEGEELRVIYSGVGGYDDDTGDFVEDVEIEEVVLLGVSLDINTLPKRLKQELYELSNDIEWEEV
ncbi:hypothetical protein N9391_01020 [Gammaproteobacteria bacterium]|nr:hypothetical protein [Gammaproteobacteria bacterium]